MNSLVKKVIVKNQEIKEFVPVGIPEGKVAERVSLSLGNQNTWTDVTDRQCLAADGVVAFGILFLPEEIENGLPKTIHLKIEVPVEGKMKVLAIIEQAHFESLTLKGDTLQLYRCTKISNRHMDLMRRKILIWKMFNLSIERDFFDTPMTKWLYRQLVATYTYPRQVFLIQIGEKIIFPIDICFFDESKGHFAFGLKVKNRLNKLIQEGMPVCIYTISSDAYEAIYELSESFALSDPDKVPAFIGNKMTMEILEFKNLKSQIFYGCAITQVEEINSQERFLHHIHFIRYLSALETPDYTVEHLKKAAIA